MSNDIHWFIAKYTHTDDTNQQHGIIIAYCGTWEQGEEKAYQAMETAELDDENFLVMRSLKKVVPGNHTKICY